MEGTSQVTYKFHRKNELMNLCIDNIQTLAKWLKFDYWNGQHYICRDIMGDIYTFLIKGTPTRLKKSKEEDSEFTKNTKVPSYIKTERINDKITVVIKELCITGFLSRLLGWLEVVNIKYISSTKEKVIYSDEENFIKELTYCSYECTKLLNNYATGKDSFDKVKESLYDLFKTVNMAYYCDEDYESILKFMEQELGKSKRKWKDIKVLKI
jgi:hypothetical protein